MNAIARRFSLLLGVGMLLLLQACATVKSADARDPWEPMNRSIYQFNDAIDTVALKPAAQLYVKVLPSMVRTGVNNFLGNLADVWSIANSAMQLKDVASEMGIEKRREDFGQTLGYWGVKPGPYVVLPLFGPSTLRDALAFPVDMQGSVTQSLSDEATRNGLLAVRLVDMRSGLLRTVDAIKAASLDPYSFVRDAYLQKRQNDIYDGNPPSRFDYSETPPASR
jgi:phospholipid-binding lipoprotein MlaA